MQDHIHELLKAAAQNICVVENTVTPAASETVCAAEDLTCKIQETHTITTEKQVVRYGRRASDFTQH